MPLIFVQLATSYDDADSPKLWINTTINAKGNLNKEIVLDCKITKFMIIRTMQKIQKDCSPESSERLVH